MKRFVLFSLLFFQGILFCRAQSSGLVPVDVSLLYSNATGNKNIASYVLWPDSFISTSEAEELYGRIESYTGTPSSQVGNLISDSDASLAALQKARKEIAEDSSMSSETKKECLKELDAEIKAIRESRAYYSSVNVPAGQNPKSLLEMAVRYAVNHKVYHGVLEVGNGFWAVSESENEDGPSHKCLGGWGVINRSGRAVTEFKYELMTESDEAHGIIKYGKGYRSGNVLYGLLHLDGTQALPCEYKQIFLSEGNHITAVYPNSAKACIYDWNMNLLSTADICYSEPWTRGTSGHKVTYYPSINRDGKVGVYDDNGLLVVPFIYDRCYSNGEYWIGITGNFPKKVDGFSISYDHLGDSPAPETRYDIFTWKSVTRNK